MAGAAGGDWPEGLGIKAVCLDFDKTLTVRHTRGAIFTMSGMEEAELRKNIADIAFLQHIVPIIISNGALVCIATFADDEEEALLSGKEMVRKYLEVAFPGKSEEYIPDNQIEAWNPENRELDMKVVGKNMHLENLRKRLPNKPKKSQMVLFDDSDRNITLARRSGYHAQFVDPPKQPGEGEEDVQSKDQGFCRAVWERFLEAEKSRGGGGGCSLQ